MPSEFIILRTSSPFLSVNGKFAVEFQVFDITFPGIHGCYIGSGVLSTVRFSSLQNESWSNIDKHIFPPLTLFCLFVLALQSPDPETISCSLVLEVLDESLLLTPTL